jgi:hypothetical protein
MKAAINTLGHVLYSPSQYVIPVFQRNYRWERPQWDKLWASLTEIQQPDKTGNHFMGFLVFVQGGVAQPGQNTRFHLIDGQQRLTTTSLLLAAIRNVAERVQQSELAQEIHEDYLVHPRRKGEYHHRLLPKAQDHEAFRAIIDRKTPPAGRMADALDYFEGKLELLATPDPEALRRLFNTVCERLEFMCATLESENAYSIFKSLNSTGVPLGQADLIRNFVFMHVHPDAQDDFDREHWTPLEAMFSGEAGRLDEASFSRFFRDVLMAESGQYVQPADTFATFETRNEATGFDPAALADRLLCHARHHAVITGAGKDDDVDVTIALAELNRLESSTTFPLLLSLFLARDGGRVESTELASCIHMLRGFIFRRFVCGESSRGYGQMFGRAIDPDAAQPVQALEQYLLDRGWPHDERFVEAFSLLPLYKRGYAREVLETLERARGHKEPAGLALAQVEHVMPQTLSAAWIEELGDEAERVHADWLHRPGNLTLSAYNQEVGNQPFAVKRARFADSNIGLTREVSTFSQWTEQEIGARGQRLAQEAATLWSGPSEGHASEEVAVQIQETRAVRLAFWTGFASHLEQSHPELPPFEPGYKRAVRMKSGVPCVSLEARYKVQEDSISLDVYFHRKALKLWSKLREERQHVDAMVGETWTFELAPKGEYAWMTLERAASSSDPAHWPALHGWLAQKLAQMHQQVLPYIREEMQVIAPSSVPSTKTDAEVDGPTETKQRQFLFWRAFVAELAEKAPTLKSHAPRPRHWQTVSLGRSGFHLSATANHRSGRLGVEVYFEGVDAKQRFAQCSESKEMIESKLGFQLEWQALPDALACRIAGYRSDSPLEEQDRWDEYISWLIDRVVRMDEVFRPIIRALP